MALFKKRPSAGGPDPAVLTFWEWWTAEGRTLAGQSIAGQLDPHTFAETMSSRVKPLGEVGWELASGETSEHVLVLTSGGDPSLRGLARRVVLAAPEADAIWSYVDSRPPVGDPESVVVEVDGRPVDFSQVRVAARMNNGRFDVQVHHPSFADLSPEGRLQVTFLALDAALGEVDTELWLGELTPIEFPPLDGFGLTALRSVVLDLKRQRLDQDGQPGWAMLQGETAQGPLVAMVRSPLHPLIAPHLDTYVGVALPYSDRTDGGLPGPEALDALRWFEERLEQELGHSGQLVAHLSSDGTRTLHLYVDSEAGLVPGIKATAKTWDQGKAAVHDMFDPGWDAVSHLRG